MTSRIPRHFHFVFGLKPQEDPFHLAYYLCLRSCIEVNQPDRVSFYYHYEPHGEYWDRIRPELELIKVDLEDFVRRNPAYDQHFEGRFIRHFKLDYAHQADFVRLKKLIEHGGVYADMDTLFVNPIPDELYENPFVIGREADVVPGTGEQAVPSLCNALMMAEPGSQFAVQWLEQSYSAFDGTWSKHSCQLAAQVAEALPGEVKIVPAHYFYRHMYTPEGLRTLFQALANDFNEVYSMHLWNHLWWDEERTDFSTFHAGLLTEAYIQEKDTTYSVIARKYL